MIRGVRERERGWGAADKRNERCWSRLYCPGSSPHPGLNGTLYSRVEPPAGTKTFSPSWWLHPGLKGTI